MKIVTHLLALLGGIIAGMLIGLAIPQMTKDGASLPSDVTVSVETQEVAILRRGTILLHDRLIDEYWFRFALGHTKPQIHEAQDTYYSEKNEQ